MGFQIIIIMLFVMFCGSLHFYGGCISKSHSIEGNYSINHYYD